MTPPPDPHRDRPAERRRRLRDTFGEFNPADAPPMGVDRARPPAEPPREQWTLLDLGRGEPDRR